MIFYQPGSHARSPVMAAHRRRLLRVATPTKVGDNQPISRCQDRDLVTPAVPGFRNAMQQHDRLTTASLCPVHLQPAKIGRMMLKVEILHLEHTKERTETSFGSPSRCSV